MRSAGTTGIDWMLRPARGGGRVRRGGEAAITGELAVCAGSCGPGNLHLINGLYDAQPQPRAGARDRRAHPAAPRSAATYFQETHPQELFRECSVYCELVAEPEQMPRLLEIAMRTAIEQRGVAVLVHAGRRRAAEDAARRPRPHRSAQPIRSTVPSPTSSRRPPRC